MEDKKEITLENALKILNHHLGGDMSKFDRVMSKTQQYFFKEAYQRVLKEIEGKAPRGKWEPANVDCRGYTNAFKCTNCNRLVYMAEYSKENDEFESCPHCRAIMDL